MPLSKSFNILSRMFLDASTISSPANKDLDRNRWSWKLETRDRWCTRSIVRVAWLDSSIPRRFRERKVTAKEERIIEMRIYAMFVIYRWYRKHLHLSARIFRTSNEARVEIARRKTKNGHSRFDGFESFN